MSGHGMATEAGATTQGFPKPGDSELRIRLYL
jgi:hypothetical protein